MVPLKRMAKRRNKKNSQLHETRVLTNSAEYGVVDQRDYFEKDIANMGNVGGYMIVDRGDYVYNPRVSSIAPVGPISRNNVGKGIMSPLYTVFRFDFNDTDFYAHYFRATHWYAYLRHVSNSGARHDRMNITNEDFMQMPLPATSSAEQQKIADCLTSLDDLISAHCRKLDALKNHKKGLMQQIFPQQGETQPRLRFPEFRGGGEWINDSLGDLGKIITGKTPSTKEFELWNGDILFITPSDISEDDKYQYTTARTVVETKSTKVLPEGSVIYTCIASIGKMALTIGPSITNQQINAVTPNKKTAGEFIYYALLNLTPWIKTIPASSTLPIINKTEFSKIEIAYPENKEEQRRIAACLTALDAQISAQTQKISVLQQHKKGLMQQLFPEEVAG